MSPGAVLGSVFVVHVLAMLSPGPNVLVVTQTAASRTRRAGVLVALGIASGAALWSGAALLGLGVLLEQQAAGLYRALTVLGGAYLLHLAFKLWRGADRPLGPIAAGRVAAPTDRQAYLLGLLTNLTNPKALVFYGSIFAALLAPDLPGWVKAAAFAVIVVNPTLWHVALACFFSTERTQRFYRHARIWIDRIAAGALALLGLRLMLAAWRALIGTP